MSGIDWNAVYDRYAPLLPRVSSRGELSDLIWEMQGELGTSHAYEMGGDHRKPPAWPLGQLGAQFELGADGESYEIVEHRARRPVGSRRRFAAQRHRRRSEGRRAHRRGERAARGQGAAAAGACSCTRRTRRSSSRIAGEKGERTVVATTVADEVPARYREWVERNREWVHAQSNGRVGYFHLPDMQSAGFAEFHRYFSAECDRDALIVDLRYNRGGHVSQLLLEKIARKRRGYALSRYMKPSPYPDEAVIGPVVALTNEHAGSDGDIFSHNFKLMGLGPLVGTRTWGGVIGIWPRHTLVDGTQTTQPEFSFWFEDVGFGVENYGTDPTIEVDNAPQDARDGRDRQLEVSLATALDLVEKAQAGCPGVRRAAGACTQAVAGASASGSATRVLGHAWRRTRARSMNERTAIAVAAVRAVETTDRAHAAWTDADRAWASRAAAEVVGESAAPPAFVGTARRCWRSSGSHRASTRVARLARAWHWRPVGRRGARRRPRSHWARSPTRSGRASASTSWRRPVAALVVWNLVVYALLAARFVVRYGDSGGRSDRALRHAPRRRHPSRRAARRTRAVAAFVEHWSTASAPLYAARAARVLHFAAAALALGVIAGLYVRGLGLEYRATWESTFLEPSSVRAWRRGHLRRGRVRDGDRGARRRARCGHSRARERERGHAGCISWPPRLPWS